MEYELIRAYVGLTLNEHFLSTVVIIGSLILYDFI